MAEFYGRIGHLSGIESPLSNAGGVAKTTQDVEQLARTGVGTIEAGSFTEEARSVQGPIHFDPETGAMYNAVKMNNCGMDELVRQYPTMAKIAKAHNKPLIINLATVSDKPAEEAVRLIHRAQAAGANVLYNPDCPSVYDADGTRRQRLSQDHEKFGEVLDALAEAELEKPIFIRIAPQESYERMVSICRLIKQSGIVSALYVSNSWQVEDSPIGPAGKSGPAMAKEGYNQTFWASEQLRRSRIDVVSSIGIFCATELKHRLNIRPNVKGAAASTLFFESEYGWAQDVNRLLTDLAA